MNWNFDAPATGLVSSKPDVPLKFYCIMHLTFSLAETNNLLAI